MLAVLLVFGQVSWHEFINFDDDLYVYDNPAVASGLSLEGLAWAFTSVSYNYWHPLTWLSHMLDAQLFGGAAGWHHFTNVLLHGLNGVLLFLLLRGLTGALYRSALVAALFALHPLRVESVAWVSERKDLLSGLFWLLTIWAYARYARAPFSRRRYGLVAAVFALGLMSKPMVVTLPLALLLLDWWPLGRIGTVPLRKLALEKAPLLAMSAAVSVVTLIGQRAAGATGLAGDIPVAERVSNALIACVSYLGKTIWPYPLAVLYPYEKTPPLWQVAAAGVLLAAVTTLAWKARRYPYLLFGWLWFLGVLVPTLGFVQVGFQSKADRFTYIPLTGLLVAVVWALADLAGGKRQAVVMALAGVPLAAFAASSALQTRHWRDSASLFRHTVAVTGANPVAHNNLGQALEKTGGFEEAIRHYQEALRLNPRYPEAHNNLGAARFRQKQYEQALAGFDEALRIQPRYGSALFNRASVLDVLQRTAESVAAFQEALRQDLKPRFASQAHNALGSAYSNQGNHALAQEHFNEAIRQSPYYTLARKNLAITLLKMRRQREAIEQFAIVAAMDPRDEQARQILDAPRAQEGKR